MGPGALSLGAHTHFHNGETRESNKSADSLGSLSLESKPGQVTPSSTGTQLLPAGTNLRGVSASSWPCQTQDVSGTGSSQ